MNNEPGNRSQSSSVGEGREVPESIKKTEEEVLCSRRKGSKRRHEQ